MNSNLGIAAVIVALTAGAGAARAGTYSFNFGGGGITGSATLTYAANPNTGLLPLTSPNPVDPIGSFVVTGISGNISDSNLGISNAAITGIVASKPAHPETGNLYAPHSFGFDPSGLSYDDLFYPGGSPRTASDYPFHGGIFDIYGLIFTITGGDAVNVWSNGYLGGISYGAAVANGANVLDYQGNIGAPGVPEPASWALLAASFGALGLAARRRRMRVALA